MQLRLVTAAGERTLDLFNTVPMPGGAGEVQAGLSMLEDRVTVTLRGAVDSVRKVSVLIPGFADASFEPTAGWEWGAAATLVRR
jgi:hypothetical protein